MSVESRLMRRGGILTGMPGSSYPDMGYICTEYRLHVSTPDSITGQPQACATSLLA